MRRLPLLCAAAFAALLLLCALPRLSLPGLHHDEAFQAAEAVLFLNGGRRVMSVPDVSGVGPNNWFLGRFPWMTLAYVGALKTYLLAGVFALFGAGVMAARGLTLCLGALSVLFCVLLSWELYGAFPALALGLWLATDPALVLMARHDWGPFILTTALKTAGLYALVSGARRARPGRIFIGGVLFGLALWDKAHFIWFLAGGGAALIFWISSREWTPRGRWAPALVGLAVGAAPFLSYNAARGFATFSTQRTLAPEAVHAFVAAWPDLLRARWSLCLGFFDGSGLISGITGVAPGDLPWRTAAVALLFIIAGALALAPSGRWAWRQAGFWLSAALLIFLAAALTPLAVGLHHMPMLYPLPQLGLAALLAGAVAGPRAAGRRAVLAALVLIAAAGNAARLRDFYKALADTRGSAEWYAGMADVARYCAGGGSPVVTLDLMYGTPLVVYTAGRVIPEEGYPPLMDDEGLRRAEAEPPAFLRRPGTLVVAFSGPEGLYRAAPQPRLLLQRWTSGAHPLLEPAAAFAYSDGGPWTGIWRVR